MHAARAVGRLVPRGDREAIREAPPARQAIEPVVAAAFAIDARELRAPTRRSPRVAFARQVAMYLAHVVCGLSLTQVGVVFARDRTTVAHACGLVEDRRDDPAVDGWLDHLEHAVLSLLDALSDSRGCA
jgi:chromosomal replication initiation ATPase DnaA